MDTTDLYNLLSSGYSAEDIAAEFTRQLNEAEERLAKEEEERKAREAEAKAREAQEEAKFERMKEIVRDYYEYIDEFYPHLADEDATEDTIVFTAQYIIRLLDVCKEYTGPKSERDVFADLFKLFF